MNWKLKSFDDLTRGELYSILYERTQVFVVEQNCPYLEVDGKDPDCYHLFAEDEGELVAYLRILPPGVGYEEVAFGRVLVKKEFRTRGMGKELVQRGLDFIRKEWPATSVKIQAQEYLERFYGSFGFKATSDVYLEDDIPHLDMVLSHKAD